MKTPITGPVYLPPEKPARRAPAAAQLAALILGLSGFLALLGALMGL